MMTQRTKFQLWKWGLKILTVFKFLKTQNKLHNCIHLVENFMIIQSLHQSNSRIKIYGHLNFGLVAFYMSSLFSRWHPCGAHVVV